MDGKKVPAWFAIDESRPLCFFAGLWTKWSGVRTKMEGEVTVDAYGFLTSEPNDVVAPIHPKAMPTLIFQVPCEMVATSQPCATTQLTSHPRQSTCV